MKKIVYVDMDNVLVDFRSGIARLTPDEQARYKGRYDEAPGIFALMDPMPGAVEAFRSLAERFDTYILSTSPWNNPTAASEKIAWVKRYLHPHGTKRVILSHHKNLNTGDYLIDDRLMRGADRFSGTLILFGSPEFPDWKSVLTYFDGVGPR